MAVDLIVYVMSMALEQYSDNDLQQSDFEEHALRVFNQGFDVFQEENGVLAVKQTMVVGEGHVHHGAGQNLVSDTNGAVNDRVHAKDGALGRVDDGGAHKRSESSSVRDGEGAALHVLNSDFSFFSLVSQMSESLNSKKDTISKSWNFMSWQFLRTGTSRPLGVATATEISMKLRLMISLPLMTELTMGYSLRARVVAFKKKDMKPNLTLYFLRKSSPSS